MMEVFEHFGHEHEVECAVAKRQGLVPDDNAVGFHSALPYTLDDNFRDVNADHAASGELAEGNADISFPAAQVENVVRLELAHQLERDARPRQVENATVI
jgi:hypothetical protein